MSAIDPQPGEVFFHPSFGGGGCEFRILKRGTRKGWGDAVWYELRPLSGERISHPQRISRMTTWPSFAADLSTTTPASPPTLEPSNE